MALGGDLHRRGRDDYRRAGWSRSAARRKCRGEAKTSFLHVREESSTPQGRYNARPSIRCSPLGRMDHGNAATARLPVRETARAGASTGHKRDQPRQNRDIENPVHRAHICQVWGITDEELPHKARPRSSCSRTCTRARSAIPQHLLQPHGPHPDMNFTRARRSSDRCLVRSTFHERDGALRRRGAARFAA